MADLKKHVAFLVLSIVMAGLFMGVAYFLAVRQGVFEPRLHFQFEAAETNGLGPGVPVTYAGYRIGSVDQIELATDGRIHGKLAVQARYQRFFTAGSVLRLDKGKIISAELAVVIKTPGKALLTDGAQIAFDAGSDTETLARELTDRFTPLINNVTHLTGQLADEKNGVAQMLKTANAAVESGHRALEMLQQRIADPRIDASYDGLSGTLKQSEQAVGKLSLTLDSATSLLQSTQQTVQRQDAQLQEVMTQVNRVLSDVRQVSQSTANTVEELRSSSAYRLIVGGGSEAAALPHDAAVSQVPRR